MNFITKWFKKPAASPRATIIPTNLEEAVRELHIAFKPSEKKEFANFSALDPGLSLHLTGGMAMRNNWRMWEPDTPLSLWFRKQGIWHPDDMSAIIYRAFWCSLGKYRSPRRNLKEMPFDLEAEKIHYITYWKRMGKGFDGVDLPSTEEKREKREYTFDIAKLNSIIADKPIKFSAINKDKNDNSKNS
jgi:hypothetical protein